MKYAIVAAIVLAGLRAEARPSAAEFKYSEWEAWNSFKEGASVTTEMTISGMTLKTTTTLKKKEAKVLTLESVTQKSGVLLEPQTRTVEKTSEEASCPKCGKPAKDHVKTKESKEKIKIGEKDLDCAVIQATLLDCAGKETGQSRGWFNKEVPGWIVRMEYSAGGGESKTICTGYSVKP